MPSLKFMSGLCWYQQTPNIKCWCSCDTMQCKAMGHCFWPCRSNLITSLHFTVSPLLHHHKPSAPEAVKKAVMRLEAFIAERYRPDFSPLFMSYRLIQGLYGSLGASSSYKGFFQNTISDIIILIWLAWHFRLFTEGKSLHIAFHRRNLKHPLKLQITDWIAKYSGGETQSEWVKCLVKETNLSINTNGNNQTNMIEYWDYLFAS